MYVEEKILEVSNVGVIEPGMRCVYIMYVYISM